MLAVAPTMAYYPTDPGDSAKHQPLGEKRRWGIFAPLYSLHREDRPGLGDLGDLEDITSWVVEQGGDVVGTLPMLASFLDEPYVPSPYAPVSRLFWNEVYLDLDSIPEWADCPVAQKVAAGCPKAQQSPMVDLREEMALKRQALEAMLAQLEESPSDRRELKPLKKSQGY